MTSDREPVAHGTISGYVRFKCRCGSCRAAWAAYKADFRLWRRTHGRKTVPGWREQLRQERAQAQRGEVAA